MYYTYALKSKKDKCLYIGWTKNLQKRFEKHNKGLIKATHNRRPLVLIYYEACCCKTDAIKREKSLKTGFGRAYLKRRISNFGE